MSTVGAWHYGQGALHPNEEIEIKKKKRTALNLS